MRCTCDMSVPGAKVPTARILVVGVCGIGVVNCGFSPSVCSATVTSLFRRGVARWTPCHEAQPVGSGQPRRRKTYPTACHATGVNRPASEPGSACRNCREGSAVICAAFRRNCRNQRGTACVEPALRAPELPQRNRNRRCGEQRGGGRTKHTQQQRFDNN